MMYISVNIKNSKKEFTELIFQSLVRFCFQINVQKSNKEDNINTQFCMRKKKTNKKTFRTLNWKTPWP